MKSNEQRIEFTFKGLREAYKEYRKWWKKFKKDKLLGELLDNDIKFKKHDIEELQKVCSYTFVLGYKDGLVGDGDRLQRADTSGNISYLKGFDCGFKVYRRNQGEI